MFQPRTLSADIPATRIGVYLRNNPYLNRSQKANWSHDKWARLFRASKFDQLNFISTVIRPKPDRLWCKINFCVAPKYLAFFSASVSCYWFVFCCLLCNFWNTISGKISNVTIGKLYIKGRFSSMYNNKDENWNSRAGLFLTNFAFFSGNQRRKTNINSNGGYCVITVQHVK